ncbi:MAG: TolC family protein [Chthoniobacter sp.]|nr:TolC family protein [Chthoniobacter sp.]
MNFRRPFLLALVLAWTARTGGPAAFAAGKDDALPELPTQAELQIPLDPIAEENPLFEAYRAEAATFGRGTRGFTKKSDVKIPADFSPWWIRGQKSSIGSSIGKDITIENLYLRALRNSKQIRVFGDLPVIRETGIREAKGAFDTNAFLQGKFDRSNDPVGNTLTTGGASRFHQDSWAFEAGAKKKFITGTEVTLSQKLGQVANNSIYFTPNSQSTGELSLSIVQPLLKGGGVGYNRATMRIAKLDSDIAMAEFVRQSESHLLEITRTYWALYAARVTYLQKAKLVEETVRIADEMKARQKVDAQQTQLFRAESALAERRADLIRNEAAIRNAQDRLKALTSDPELLASANIELIPGDRLVLAASVVDAEQAAATALDHRPEINQAFLQLRAATLRENMQRNELLPELNLVLQGSLGGLSGGDYADAYGKQYHEGGPGFSAGFIFSIPLENNIARARLDRRRLELRQQLDQLKTTIDSVFLEVKISAREAATAFRETQAKYSAVKAFTADVEFVEARRALQTASPAPGVNDEARTTIFLDNLLDAQDRRSNAEEEFIRAAANYQIAIVNLERAKGQLLAYSDVRVIREKDPKGLPVLRLEKGGRDGKSHTASK